MKNINFTLLSSPILLLLSYVIFFSFIIGGKTQGVCPVLPGTFVCNQINCFRCNTTEICINNNTCVPKKKRYGTM